MRCRADGGRRFLVAANEGRDTIVIFGVDSATVRLSSAGRVMGIGSRLSIVFRPARGGTSSREAARDLGAKRLGAGDGAKRTTRSGPVTQMGTRGDRTQQPIVSAAAIPQEAAPTVAAA